MTEKITLSGIMVWSLGFTFDSYSETPCMVWWPEKCVLTQNKQTTKLANNSVLNYPASYYMDCDNHMGPEDPSNRKKYPSFFLKPSRRKLQNISKNVSLKIGSKLPQKLSQIFKNAHYKISCSKGPKYP